MGRGGGGERVYLKNRDQIINVGMIGINKVDIMMIGHGEDTKLLG